MPIGAGGRAAFGAARDCHFFRVLKGHSFSVGVPLEQSQLIGPSDSFADLAITTSAIAGKIVAFEVLAADPGRGFPVAGF
jgi:hypothetical protein